MKKRKEGSSKVLFVVVVDDDDEFCKKEKGLSFIQFSFFATSMEVSLFMFTRWNNNLSWILLSYRRSCMKNRGLFLIFTHTQSLDGNLEIEKSENNQADQHEGYSRMLFSYSQFSVDY